MGTYTGIMKDSIAVMDKANGSLSFVTAYKC